jgi:hypothetical protein
MRGKLMFGAASAALLAWAIGAPAMAQDADPAGDATTQSALLIGQSVGGAIETNTDTDWYRLSAQQGQRYIITLEAGAAAEGEPTLDPYLVLYDAEGNELASNDDHGGTLNSRVAFTPQASGEVFVEARAFADSSTGPYTLRAEASAVPPDDVGNDASTRGRISAGQPAHGVIEYEGDVDWYRFSARPGYSYRITLTGAEGESGLSDPLLRVVDSEGADIAYNDDDDGLNSGLDFVPGRSGVFYIVAAGYSDAHAGAYTLNVVGTRLPDDPASADIRTRGRIRLGQTVNSQLDYAGDRDWYRIRLNAGETYRFALNSDGEAPLDDPLLRLYDARGTEVAMDDDGGGNLNSLLEYAATSTGTYYVEAAGFNQGATGSYALSAREGDIPADVNTDMRLSAEGDYREGMLSPAGDRDWYRLTLSEGQTVRIGLSSLMQDGLDTMAVLYDAQGQEVARDDDGGDGLNSWLEYTAGASGDYFLEARAFTDDGQGGYVISLSPGEISDNSDTNEMLMPNGDGRNSTIGVAGDVDWFAIELVEGRPYRFTVEGFGETPLADPVLTIYDATGQQMATDDDGGVGANAYLGYASPTGGPHFVAVSGFGDATGGYFVRGVDTEAPGHIYTDEMLDAANGDERANRIEIPGDLDYYRVDLEAGARYVMEVRAIGPHPLGNPMLTLVDSENNTIASDNDGGRGRNALLRFTAREAGSYYIQASGLGGSTGSYQVSIVRQ